MPLTGTQQAQEAKAGAALFCSFVVPPPGRAGPLLRALVQGRQGCGQDVGEMEGTGIRGQELAEILTLVGQGPAQDSCSCFHSGRHGCSRERRDRCMYISQGLGLAMFLPL